MRHVVLASVAAGSFMAIWLASEPKDRSISLYAREMSFDLRNSEGKSFVLPALEEPAKIRTVTATDVSAIDGARAPRGSATCAFTKSADLSDWPPELGPFRLVKPVVSRSADATVFLVLRADREFPELLFRSASARDGTFEAEVGLAAGPAETEPSEASARPTSSPGPCRARASSSWLPAQSLTLNGWLETSWNARSFVVWDRKLELTGFSAVLTKPGTFGVEGGTCPGSPGDELTVKARRVVLRALGVEPEGLSVRVDLSPDWSMEVGGCSVSARWRQWRETFAVWFRGFLAFGGTALISAGMRFLWTGEKQRPPAPRSAAWHRLPARRRRRP